MKPSASWTTTGKNCPLGGVCQSNECWKLGEAPCSRWEAGERPQPAPVMLGNGIAVTVVGMAPIYYAARVMRVDKLGVAFIEGRGRQFAFTFDKIVGYRGEPPKDIGLVVGATVDVATSGQFVTSVRLASPSGVLQHGEGT